MIKIRVTLNEGQGQYNEHVMHLMQLSTKLDDDDFKGLFILRPLHVMMQQVNNNNNNDNSINKVVKPYKPFQSQNHVKNGLPL